MYKRESGILLHISSLPSKYGIGTLGYEAYAFVDFLNKAKMTIWQILPLNMTSYGDSPYQSPSSIALNPYFIDLDLLNEDSLLNKDEYENINWGEDEGRVDYQLIFNNRMNVLEKAFKRFNRTDTEFKEFLEEKEYQDFGVFMAIKEKHHLKAWYEWDDKYKNYSVEIENEVLKEDKDLVEFYEWTQFIFLKQYKALKSYANSKGIKIMGDMPIYVARDSVELWKNPNLFQVDEKHNPTRVAGCPPDCFSEDGQLWGNPLYNWEYCKKTDYKWWNERIYYNLSLFDYLRIDHFRGFSAYYSIPAQDKTARNGKWVKGPGFDLFKDKLKLPIVAEDLGMLDDDFYKLMKDVGYPGMKIVTQGFDGDPKSIWKPSNYTENYFSYSGTHDSQTTCQYLDELNKEQKEVFLKDLVKECEYFHISCDVKATNQELTHKICELNMMSKTRAAICPIQDYLGIGKIGRMNYPSSLSNMNWSWRVKKDAFSKDLVDYIRKLVDESNRFEY